MTTPAIPESLTHLLNAELLPKELAERLFLEFIRQACPMIDPAPFVPAKHIEIMCEALSEASRLKIQFLINVPPRQYQEPRRPHSLELATQPSVICVSPLRGDRLESGTFWGNFTLSAHRHRGS